MANEDQNKNPQYKNPQSGNNKNKILFIATVESHILNFHIPFIKYFQEKGYEVHVATKLGDRIDELQDINIVCHNVDFTRSPYSLSNFKAFRHLINLMRENKFSLVHVHTPVAAFLGRLAAQITGTKPVIYTAHGFHFYQGAPTKNWLIYYSMEKIAARWTDGLITMNDEDYKAAMKFHLRKRNAVYLVHGVGLELNKYRFDNREENLRIRDELGIGYYDIVILTVAELNVNKNHIQLLKALSNLDLSDRIKYLIVGIGETEHYIKEFILNANMGNKVKLLGYRNDIPELLHASDIFALTSMREGLPRCVMEAMAAGKPVIATDVRGNRDLVKDGINGFLVPLGDVEATAEALEKLINDDKLRKSLGEKGKTMIEDYSIEKVLEEMDYIYSSYLDMA